MKKIIYIIALCGLLLLTGCVSGMRDDLGRAIGNRLNGPEPTKPSPDFSDTGKNLEKTGGKAGNLLDDLSGLASGIGASLGEGLSDAASSLGSAAGSDLSDAGKAADGAGKTGKKDKADVPSAADGTPLEGPLHILKVVDGDTVKFKEYGKDVRFRLIGCDTPESVAGEEYLEASGKENTAEGRDASAFMKELLPEGAAVYMEYDAERQDRYGRELVYLYTEKDGGLVMVNELLLEEGLARMLTLQPNVRYADTVFLDAQRRAAEGGRGFWGTGFFEE